jgi:hypothetical protein
MRKRSGTRDLEKEKYWREIVLKQKASRISQKKFCLSEGLNWHTFSSWKIILQRRDFERSGSSEQKRQKKTPQIVQPKPFVPVVFRPEFSNNQSNALSPVAEIDCAGVRIRILPGADVETLRALLQAIKEPVDQS